MKRKLLLCFTILPLLIASLAGCSSDEDEETDPSMIAIYELPGGRTVRLYETEAYPDSVLFYHGIYKPSVNDIYVPCQPIPFGSLPKWCHETLFNLASWAQADVFLGEFTETKSPVYVLQSHWYTGAGLPLIYTFLNDGSALEIYADQSESYSILEGRFLSMTSNWRLIFRLEFENIKKHEI